MDQLHWYQCRNCKTWATSPVRILRRSQLCCNLCHSYMKYQWSEPIETEIQRDLARRGIVWNPGSLAADVEGRS